MAFDIPVGVGDGALQGWEIPFPVKKVIEAVDSASNDFQVIVGDVRFPCNRLFAAAVCKDVMSALISDPERNEFVLDCDEKIDIAQALKGRVNAGPFEMITMVKMIEAASDVKPVFAIETEKVKYFVHQLFVDVFCEKPITERLKTIVDMTEVIGYLSGQCLHLTRGSFDTIVNGAEVLGMTSLLVVLRALTEKMKGYERPIAVISLESLIYDISAKTLQRALCIVKESKFFKDPNEHYVIVEMALAAGYVRPVEAQYMVEFLFELAKSDQFKECLRTYALSRLCKKHISKWVIRKLMLKGVFTAQEIVDVISDMMPKHRKFNCYAFIDGNDLIDTVYMFIGEVKELSGDKLERLPTNTDLGQPETDDNLFDLSIEDLKALTDAEIDPNPLIAAISSDNVDALQDLLSSDPNVDYDMIVKGHLCSRTWQLRKKRYRWGATFLENVKGVTLLGAAAFYNAIDCFKFLVMNNASLAGVERYAVMSGNNEMVRMCEQNGCVLNCRHAVDAILYHRQDLYQWIGEKSRADFLHSENLKNMCIASLDCGNYETFVQLLERYDKANDPLLYAVVRGLTEITRRILETPNMKLNHDNTDNPDHIPLAASIKSNFDDITRMLLADPRIDMNHCGAVPALVLALRAHNKPIAMLIASRMTQEQIDACLSDQPHEMLALLE